MKIHPSITLERIEQLIRDGGSTGICLACGLTAYGVEPDARRYRCEACGQPRVYGAEELLIMVQP